jgi:hypothetical protein
VTAALASELPVAAEREPSAPDKKRPKAWRNQVSTNRELMDSFERAAAGRRLISPFSSSPDERSAGEFRLKQK